MRVVTLFKQWWEDLDPVPLLLAGLLLTAYLIAARWDYAASLYDYCERQGRVYDPKADACLLHNQGAHHAAPKKG